MTANMPGRVVLIIPVYNKPELTQACLASILQHAARNPAAEILVIDDGSESATQEVVRQFPVTLLTNPKNLGYLAATNRGMRHALDDMQADFVVLMNNDLLVRDDWLARLLAVMDRCDISGYSNAGKKWYWRQQAYQPTQYLEGSCMLFKRQVLNQIGILDDCFVKGYYSDDDICLRALRAGFSLGLGDNGRARYVAHLGGQTFGSRKWDYMRADYDVFMNKWRPMAADSVVADYLRHWMFNPHHPMFRLLEWLVARFTKA